jgi:hypothetical protein
MRPLQRPILVARRKDGDPRPSTASVIRRSHGAPPLASLARHLESGSGKRYDRPRRRSGVRRQHGGRRQRSSRLRRTPCLRHFTLAADVRGESAFQAVWSLRRPEFCRASRTSSTPIYPLIRPGRAELGLPRTGTPALGDQSDSPLNGWTPRPGCSARSGCWAIPRTCSSTLCLTEAEPGQGNLELTIEVDQYPTDWSLPATPGRRATGEHGPPVDLILDREAVKGDGDACSCSQ